MHTEMPVMESDAPLGPVLTTKVELEGSRVTALIDTGSPVTVVSLKFLIEKQQPLNNLLTIGEIV